MIRVTKNFRKIQDLLAKAATDAGRAAESVRLLAVSKRKPVESILEAAAMGQRDFAENFLQEGLKKLEQINDDALIWHFIGHLQTNKTRPVAENFHWVHTLERLNIAERLSRQRPNDADDLNICIQVNIDREEAKSGVLPENLKDLAVAVADLPNLKLRGLMCLPAIRDTFDDQRKPFAQLRMHLETLQECGLEVDTLSMGMSGDFEAAIHEGATIVRIGTALFGERNS